MSTPKLRSPTAAALLVVLTCSSCDCSGAGEEAGQSGVVHIADGEGATNAEPLWPLAPGWLMQGGDEGRYAYTLAALDARVVNGVTVIPLASTTRAQFEFVGVPSEPALYRYLSVDSDGIWFRGQPREGLLEPGALLVPSTVRVGMKWESWIDGEKRVTGEVVSREEMDTIFGRRTVWTLNIFDDRRYWYEGPDLADSPRLTGSKKVMTLAEGLGPITHDIFGTAGYEATLTLPNHIVVPLGDAPPAIEPPVVTLRAVDDKPLVENFLVKRAGAIPQADGSIVVSLSGETISFGESFIGDAEGGGSDGGRWGSFQAYGCGRLRGDAIEAVSVDAPECVPADSLLQMQDGTTHGLPFFAHSGDSVPEAHCPTGSLECIPMVHQFRGLFEKVGVPIALAWSAEGYAAPPGSISIGRYDSQYYVENALSFPDGFEVYPTVLPFLMARPHGHDSSGREFFWTRRHDDGHVSVVDPGAQDHLSGSGRIAFTRLEEVPHTAAEHWVYPAMEVQSTVTAVGANQHFLFGYEGLLRRAHLERDGVSFEPIAQLTAPEDEFLTAAFVVDGEIVAFSQRGFQGADPWYTEDGINRTIPATNGDVYVLRAPVPAATPAARPASVFGIQARPVDRDMRVCWSAGAGAADPATFRLGGVSPAHVIVDDNCVLLVREHVSSQRDLLAPGAWTVEGEVPGAGRVMIAVSPEVWSDQHQNSSGRIHAPGREHVYDRTGVLAYSPAVVGAPLTGGGWISKIAAYGPGMLSVLDKQIPGRVAQDAAGSGLWAYQPAFNDHKVILHGARGSELVVDLEPFVAAKGIGATSYDVWPSPVAGPSKRIGGVLVGDLWARPDGTVVDLPEPVFRSRDAQWTPLAVFEDGGVCGALLDVDDTGLGVSTFTCLAPDGMVRESVPFPTLSNLTPPIPTDGAVWFVFADEAGQPRLQRIDLDTLEVTAEPLAAAVPVDEYGVEGRRVVAYVRHDPIGQTYVLFTAQWGAHVLLRFDDGGPTVVELPELEAMTGASQIDVVAEQDLFVFVLMEVRMGNFDFDALAHRPPDMLRVPTR